MARLQLRAIKPACWPELDKRLWALARAEPDDEDDEGRAASDWSPKFISNCEFFYGQYLRFLEITGQLDPEATPLQRTTRELIRSFLNAYEPGHAETSCAGFLTAVSMLVDACHPGVGNRYLARLAARRSERAKPLLPKITRTASIAELLDLGEFLIADSRPGLADGNRKAAEQFRNGLMILFLTIHPIRRKNLVGLKIGETLIIDGTDVRVHFDAEDTKNKSELVRVYPDWVSAYVLEYIKLARPLLLEHPAANPDQGDLWISHHGKVIRGEVVRVIIRRLTKEHLGRAVPPHLFRHSVVTDIAVNDPKHAGIARDILGHRDYRTTEKAYILANQVEALRRLQAANARRRRHK